MEENISYTEAYAEIQEIVTEMETSEISIDLLDSKIKRASELLKICKKKLFETEESVKGTLEGMDI